MLIIAVDGPSCAGKGSICKELSKRLNIKHVDTGSIYRVLAYYMHSQNIDIYDFVQSIQKTGVFSTNDKNAFQKNF